MSDLVKRLRQNWDKYHLNLRNEAADEIERLQADAARYRWLRDVDDDPYNLKSMWYAADGGAAAVDAAIDAAMKEKQERK